MENKQSYLCKQSINYKCKMNISERIKVLIEELGLDAKTFATTLNINPSSISHLTSGRNKPSFDFLQRIAQEFPEIDIHWLLTGKGKLFKSETENYVKQKKENTSDSAELHQGVFAVPDINKTKNEEKVVIEKKQIDKIILLYTDGSFKIYDHENL